MAAQSVSDRELAALHDRIGRDVAELRTRWRRLRAQRVRPNEVVGAAAEVFRAMRALQGLASSVRVRSS